MSAEVLKYVEPDGTVHDLNFSNTRIDDSTTSGEKAWSSSKTKEYVDNTASTLQNNINRKANNDTVNSLSITVSNHTSNTSNPHGVTASQLGLGSVENHGMDSSPTSGSSNYVSSGGVYTAVDGKSEVQLSGTHKATVNFVFDSSTGTLNITM